MAYNAVYSGRKLAALRVLRISQARNQQGGSDWLLDLLFCPDDGKCVYTFSRDVNELLVKLHDDGTQ
jgi:hypothetical protein